MKVENCFSEKTLLNCLELCTEPALNYMLFESKNCFLGQKEIGIHQRTERAIVTPICGMKMVDRKLTKDPLQVLGLEETIGQLGKANGVHLNGTY